MSRKKMLTEVELELMAILWKLGEGSVNDVIEGLPRGRDLAYTSVSTMLRILEQKGIVKARKEGRGHIYIPAIQREEYGARAIHHMVETVFETPVDLARQLLSTVDLNSEELKQLRSLLNEQEKRK